ncbi:MAG: hypothetical protein A2Y03_04830 [Omnitrophica WOR_2 bacterium GWF2_38_59]|nr:MAG: hypothetical protein A2Y03_04830 [Omnitrophica WOR_2 bacterium GWF2_38_59]OGX55477.1 MAG: hypothetical protein A2447_03245 [Omnitrophica WOR_2 bacterium RIFOXYC2_FULL_38_12]
MYKLNKTTGILLLILLFALCLRIANLYSYDLWFDEIWTDMFSSQFHDRSAELFHKSSNELLLDKMKSEPPSSFYYFFIYFYSKIFSSGKALRIISVIFSMCSLLVFFRVCLLFFDRKTSIYALLIMALNPFHIWYAQEARVYAMACFFSLLVVYNFISALKTDKTFYWISFLFAGIFCLASSYLSVFLFITTGIIVLIGKNRKYFKKWLLCFLIIISVLALFSPILLNQLRVVKNDFSLPGLTVGVMLFTWPVFMLGYSATKTQYIIGLFLFIDLFAFGVYCSWLKSKFNTISILLFLFFPIISIIFFSKLVMPIYLNRQLLIFSPFLYIFIAFGLSNIEKKGVQRLIIFCVVFLLLTVNINYYRGYMQIMPLRKKHFGLILPKKKYMDIYNYLAKEYKDGDLIVAADGLSYTTTLWHIIKFEEKYKIEPFESFRFYCFPKDVSDYNERYFTNMDGQFLINDNEALSELHEFSPFWDSDRKLRVLNNIHSDYNRIWLITSIWEESGRIYGNSAAVQRFASENYKEILSMEKNGYFLSLYDMKSPPLVNNL